MIYEQTYGTTLSGQQFSTFVKELLPGARVLLPTDPVVCRIGLLLLPYATRDDILFAESIANRAERAALAEKERLGNGSDVQTLQAMYGAADRAMRRCLLDNPEPQEAKPRAGSQDSFIPVTHRWLRKALDLPGEALRHKVKEVVRMADVSEAIELERERWPRCAADIDAHR